MKLLRCRMSAFGPFTTTQVVELHGAGDGEPWVLHGASGSGKRAVLDALAFGLFGLELGVARHGQPMRSSDAAKSRATEVELELQVEGRSLRVRRRPASGRKAGVAKLWQRPAGSEVDSGDDGELLADGAEAVDAQLRELLSLHPSTFATLRSLPVGEVRAWLSDPERLVRELQGATPLGDFEALEEQLDRRLAPIEREAEELVERREQVLAEAARRLDPSAQAPLQADALAVELRFLTTRDAILGKQLEELDEAVETTEQLLESAIEHEQRLEKIKEAEKALAAIEEGSPEADSWRRRVERARTAAQLSADRPELERSELFEEHDRVREALETVQAAFRQGEQEVERHERVLAAEEARAEAIEADRQHRTQLDELFTVRNVLEEQSASLAESTKLRGEAEDRLRRLSVEIEEATVARAAREAERDQAAEGVGGQRLERLKNLRERVENSERVVSQARRLAEVLVSRKEVTKKHATAKIQLDRARRDLEREDRYLVQARGGDQRYTSESELTERRRRVDTLKTDITTLGVQERELGQSVTDLGQEVLKLRQALGSDAYTEPSLLESAAERAREQLELAGGGEDQLAAHESALLALSEKKRQLERDRDAAQLDLEGLVAREETEGAMVFELEERLPEHLRAAGALETVSEELDRRIEEHETKLAESRERLKEAQRELDGLAQERELAAKSELQARKKVETVLGQLREVVIAAGFSDLNEYRGSRLDPEQVEELAAKVAAHDEAVAAARQTLNEARGATDLPALRESDRAKWEDEEWERRQKERRDREQAGRVLRDREYLEDLAAETRSAREEVLTERASWVEVTQVLQATEKEITEVSERLRALRERHVFLSRLADQVAGRLSGAPSLASFVRETLLEETLVRSAAWARSLSDDRFELRRTAEGELLLCEVHGRRQTSMTELAADERLLAALAICLGRADALALQAGCARPSWAHLVGGLEGLNQEESERARGYLRRLESTLGPVVAVCDEEAPPAGFEAAVALGGI
ncbi:MAG: AAA family ATPase [Acidobacteriota bacterium]